MTARQVPNEAIRAAAERWRGNVAGAADEVHIKRDHFRERCRRLRIDLDALRQGGAPSAPLCPLSPLPAQAKTGDRKVAGAPYPKLVEMPTVSSVSSTVSDFGRRMDKPIRVQPEHGDRIRSGRRRLSAEADTDLDDTQLLAEFIEEGFEDWLKGKLAAIRHARTEDTK